MHGITWVAHLRRSSSASTPLPITEMRWKLWRLLADAALSLSLRIESTSTRTVGVLENKLMWNHGQKFSISIIFVASIINCSDETKLYDRVSMAHGWGTLRKIIYRLGDSPCAMHTFRKVSHPNSIRNGCLYLTIRRAACTGSAKHRVIRGAREGASSENNNLDAVMLFGQSEIRLASVTKYNPWRGFFGQVVSTNIHLVKCTIAILQRYLGNHVEVSLLYQYKSYRLQTLWFAAGHIPNAWIIDWNGDGQVATVGYKKFFSARIEDRLH